MTEAAPRSGRLSADDWAREALEQIAEAGVGCLKIEGRKKKPEFVATVTKGYREFLERVEQGTFAEPTFEEVQPLVQIFSRGFTGGMYGGREGREYITRTQPDNRGLELGTVVGFEANGGTLLGTDVTVNDEDLTRLPTRDAILPLLSLQAKKQSIRLRVEVAPATPPVLCDRTMVEQVLLNLARNGMQAMPFDDPPISSGLRVLSLQRGEL